MPVFSGYVCIHCNWLDSYYFNVGAMKLYDFYLRYWRVYAGWFPIQLCMVCAKPYWGGFPQWEKQNGKWEYVWEASYKEYCSQECCEEDLDWM